MPPQNYAINDYDREFRERELSGFVQENLP